MVGATACGSCKELLLSYVSFALLLGEIRYWLDAGLEYVDSVDLVATGILM